MSKILAAAFNLIIDAFFRPTLERAKIRSALTAIETVQATRKAALAAFAFIVCAVVVGGGAILIPFALCSFMPWEANTRLWVGLSFAVAYIALPVVLVWTALSEKRIMRLLHVDDLLRNIADR